MERAIMKGLLNTMKILAALALLDFAVGCATQQKEKLLSTAGFKTISVSTPEEQQHLRTLKHDKITAVTRNGKTYYVFPDPAHNQYYVGDQAQYQHYRQLRAQQKLTDEEIAADIDAHENKMLKRMLEGWD